MHRTLHPGTCGLLLLCAAVLTGLARPQVTNYPAGSTAPSSSVGRGGAASSVSPMPGNDFPGTDPNLSHRQMVSRREDLKRHMVENAARLLVLTRDLQTELQSREPNGGDAKRLDDIAKLARSVRDQMRQ